MRKLTALLLALLLGAMPCALASTGDTTVFYQVMDSGMGYNSLDSCMLVNNRVIYTTGSKLYVYDIETRETAEYEASALTDLNGPEEESIDFMDDAVDETYREIAS